MLLSLPIMGKILPSTIGFAQQLKSTAAVQPPNLRQATGAGGLGHVHFTTQIGALEARFPQFLRLDRRVEELKYQIFVWHNHLTYKCIRPNLCI